MQNEAKEPAAPLFPRTREYAMTPCSPLSRAVFVHVQDARRTALARIQGDIAQLTCLIDQLLHQFLSADEVPEESEELFVNSANLMREQLELLASKIITVHMDNLRKDKGLPASDKANLLIDPQTFNKELKAAKDLSAAFAPSRSISSSSNLDRRAKSGKQDYKQQQSCKYDLEHSMRHYVDNRMYQSLRRLTITGVAALGNEALGREPQDGSPPEDDPRSLIMQPSRRAFTTAHSSIRMVSPDFFSQMDRPHKMEEKKRRLCCDQRKRRRRDLLCPERKDYAVSRKEGID